MICLLKNNFTQEGLKNNLREKLNFASLNMNVFEMSCNRSFFVLYLLYFVRLQKILNLCLSYFRVFESLNHVYNSRS